MRYVEFEEIMSPARMDRYLTACANDSKKAMAFYRKNLILSQELFTVISCFEVALRNAIDRHYLSKQGNDWLRDAGAVGGIFDNSGCRTSASTINYEVMKLGPRYSHGKLIAAMDFGFWRYLFSPHQYRAGGQSLLKVFQSRPMSTPTVQYNAAYIFNELARINRLRNRIAHHEPICFAPAQSVKDTTYSRQYYALLLQLFHWMSIDESALLYGLDHISGICKEIDRM